MWLTRDDQQDAAIMAALPGVLSDLRARGHYPVVFRSGTEALYGYTLALLRHNRYPTSDGDWDRDKS